MTHRDAGVDLCLAGPNNKVDNTAKALGGWKKNNKSNLLHTCKYSKSKTRAGSHLLWDEASLKNRGLVLLLHPVPRQELHRPVDCLMPIPQ